ncbi:diguanylate cyclase [uncultured Ruminococcus sp.]|uniref:sensor domain-containing diguanylate cyclase n=1 Tax=uncultured Ruminococcus sp. TaxID=165186 RepID=UPI002639B4F5|nr:diguanylate cyclase [uncultured Ruminococcus sp.]
MKQFQFEYSNAAAFREELIRLKQRHEITSQTAIVFQIYSELLDYGKMEKLSSVIEQEMPDALYVGCSANGNILNGQFSSSSIVIICTVFEKPSTKVKLLQFDFAAETVDNVVSSLLKEAEENPWVKAIEMYVTIPEISTSGFCDGLKDLRPDIQVFGGVACSDDITSSASFVFSKAGECSDRSIVFLLYGGEEFYVDSMYVTGWKPLGRKFYVTKAEGSILYELDGKPAYDAYRNYLNIKNDEHFFYNTLEFPLFYEHNGITILRTPLTSNADGSLTMTSDIETGSVTRIAYGNPCTILDIVQADSQKIRDFLPDVLHIFSCAARRTFWNSDTETIKELQPFKSIAPTSGFFTHGEFLRSNGCLNQHNVTLVIGAMREGEPVCTAEPDSSTVESLLKSEKVPVVTRLATFIGAAAAELEEMNRKLETVNYELEVVNHKLELAAIYDGLTNLYNRSEIQKRITYCLSHISENTFSLIMLDIDNFKRVNDTYGHQVGDTVIIALSKILRSDIEKYAPGACSGRWGGEEFMVLLPGCDSKQAVSIAEMIRKCFADTAFPAATNQTVSLGVTQAKDDEDLDALCIRVDSALYQAKKTGKNRVNVM